MGFLFILGCDTVSIMNKKHIIFLIILAVMAGLAFMLFDQEQINHNTENHQITEQIKENVQNQATTTKKDDREDYMIPKVKPKKYSELTPLPEDFEEFIIASGTVRFGVPREWGMTNTFSKGSVSTFKTDDYNQIIATELQGDDDYVIKSGYYIDLFYGAFHHDRYGDRCSIAANKDTCFETNLLDNWYTYRLNDNYFEENLQYIYIAQSKTFGSLEVVFYPPQTADIEETEALFTKILKTVELIESE